MQIISDAEPSYSPVPKSSSLPNEIFSSLRSCNASNSEYRSIIEAFRSLLATEAGLQSLPSVPHRYFDLVCNTASGQILPPLPGAYNAGLA